MLSVQSITVKAETITMKKVSTVKLAFQYEDTESEEDAADGCVEAGDAGRRAHGDEVADRSRCRCPWRATFSRPYRCAEAQTADPRATHATGTPICWRRWRLCGPSALTPGGMLLARNS